MYYNPNYGGGGWPMPQPYWPSYNYAAYPQMYGYPQSPAAPQAPATGAQRDGMGWRAVRRQTRPLVEQQQSMLTPLQNRMAVLQGKGGTPGPRRQAKMDELQGRIDTVQGSIHDLNNMWRTGRRQQNSYDPNAAGSPQAGRAAGPSPGPSPAGAPPSFYEANLFNTPWGQLVQSSTGNGNLYKKNGASENDGLYYYDPSKGWQQTSVNDYRNWTDQQAFGLADPNQYAAQAGGNRQDWTFKNGMWQGAIGTGNYA